MTHVDLSEIKKRYNCFDYCRDQRWQFSPTITRGVSPLRPDADNKTSFSVSENYFIDYAGDLHGDVIDLCAIYEHNGDLGAAITQLAEKTGVVGYEQYQEKWLPYMQALSNEIEAYHQDLQQEELDYLHSRRITNETIETLKIGVKVENGERRILIPYWSNNHPVYYITRGKNPKYKKAYLDGFNQNVVFGLDTLKRNKDTLVIAEGAFDVLSFYQEGFCVLGTMGGAFNKEQLKAVLSIARDYKKVVFVFDNDNAGKSFALKLGKVFFDHRLRFRVGIVPTGNINNDNIKDVSDFYCANGNLQDLIDKSENGINYLAGTLKNEDDVDAFARKARRFLKKEDMAYLFSSLLQKHIVSPEWLKEAKKKYMKAPPDQEIAREVLENHKLLYDPTQGFKEYKRTHYESLKDNDIKTYIDKSLDWYSTGAKLNSILNIIKAKSNSNCEYNTKPLFNFANGTLDLDTLELHEHKETDLLTYCLNYNYDPEAKSEKWLKFMEDITMGDEEKIKLLQMYCGYILFPDNRYQQCLCLIGAGANGKSVFCKVIKALFSNVTNVEMHELAKDFNAIRLKDSILNVAGETKSNVKGSEECFKQVIDGSEISDSYKGKDKISFIPRAKWIISTNQFMLGSDDSEGWLRRFIFCRFPVHFVKNPTRVNEKAIDVTLESKLTKSKELSGIFNWVLEGYQLLKKENELPETEESKETREEYDFQLRPVKRFIKEFDFSGYSTLAFISTKSLYEEYKDWCAETGRKLFLTLDRFGNKLKTFVDERFCPCLKYNPSHDESGYLYLGGGMNEDPF